MKSFKFSLQAVLTVREREKDAAAQAWAAAVQAQNRCEQALEAAKRDLEQFHRQLEEKRRGRFLSAADQQLFISAIGTQKLLCETLLEDLSKAIQLANIEHGHFLQARMNHEVLVRLRDKKMNEFTSLVQSREEAAIEEMVIVRHKRVSCV